MKSAPYARSLDVWSFYFNVGIISFSLFILYILIDLVCANVCIPSIFNFCWAIFNDNKMYIILKVWIIYYLSNERFVFKNLSTIAYRSLDAVVIKLCANCKYNHNIIGFDLIFLFFYFHFLPNIFGLVDSCTWFVQHYLSITPITTTNNNWLNFLDSSSSSFLFLFLMCYQYINTNSFIPAIGSLFQMKFSSELV